MRPRIELGRRQCLFYGAIKFGAVIGVMAAMLTGTILPAYAETGTVQVNVAKAGFIVGVGGGSGTLRFKGKTYRLRVDGISAGTIGVARAVLVGTASNLRVAEDIVGTYSAVSAGIAVAGGGKSARLQNSKGVILELHGRQVGFDLSLNLSGVSVTQPYSSCEWSRAGGKLRLWVSILPCLFGTRIRSQQVQSQRSGAVTGCGQRQS